MRKKKKRFEICVIIMGRSEQMQSFGFRFRGKNSDSMWKKEKDYISSGMDETEKQRHRFPPTRFLLSTTTKLMLLFFSKEKIIDKLLIDFFLTFNLRFRH